MSFPSTFGVPGYQNIYGQYSQEIEKFLSDSRLEYTPSEKQVIKDQMTQLVMLQAGALHKHLIEEVFDVSSQDWREQFLVSLHLLVRTQYEGNSYYFPVRLSIPKNYPQTPPKVYLNPAPDMVINQSSQFIDSDGSVKFEQIFWGTQTRTLVALCQKLGYMFAQEPPMWKRQQTSQNVTGNSNTTGLQGQSQSIKLQGPGINNVSGVRPPFQTNQSLQNNNLYQREQSIGHNSQANSQFNQHPHPPPQVQRQQLAHQYSHNSTIKSQNLSVNQTGNDARTVPQMEKELKQQLVFNLSWRYEEAEKKLNQKIQNRLLKDLDQQNELDNYSSTIQKQIDAVQGQIIDVDNRGQFMQREVEAMTKFKQKYGSKLQQLDDEKIDLTVDQLIVPKDMLMEVTLKEQSKDKAIEETLMELQKLVHESQIEPEIYISKVRELSRKQFNSKFIQIKAKRQFEQKY